VLFVAALAKASSAYLAIGNNQHRKPLSRSSMKKNYIQWLIEG
jgi:hypothetical protein